MTTNAGTDKSHEGKEVVTILGDRWIRYVVGAISAGVTSAVTAVITVITITAVLIGGLWLAYTYLPLNVFHIILAVLLVDILAGILLRALFARRRDR